MKLKEYIKDELFKIILIIVYIILICGLLCAFNFGVQMAALMAVLAAIFFIIMFIWDFCRKRNFYNSLIDNTQRIDKKYLVIETLDEPEFYEGNLVYTAMYDINKSMIEHINQYERGQQDFKDFIEMWVHEIKLPIASLTLMCHNDKEHIDKKFITQLNRLDDYADKVLYYVRSENAEKDYSFGKVNLKTIINKTAVKNKDIILSNNISIFVANMFGVNIEKYRFVFSHQAFVKTLIYFAIIYVIVILFNMFCVNKYKLIDLLTGSRKAEKATNKNPYICAVVWIISVVLLAFAYYKVSDSRNLELVTDLAKYIVMGCAGTFLFFWSLSGIMFSAVHSMKKVYYKGLNSFVFRQMSSRMNSNVFAMTVICLMMFITICVLSSGLTVRNSLVHNIDMLSPADVQIEKELYSDDEAELIKDYYKRKDIDLEDILKDIVDVYVYNTSELTINDTLGNTEAAKANNPDIADNIDSSYFDAYYSEDIMKLSDYNKVAALYGNEQYSLSSDEYIIVADFKSMAEVRNKALDKGVKIALNGELLKPKYNRCSDGFVQMSSNHINIGIVVVPDEVLETMLPTGEYYIGNYNIPEGDEREAVDKKIVKIANGAGKEGIIMDINTLISVKENSMGLGAMIAFIALYIGLIFLISGAAILALKELSESADNLGRYKILKNLGTDNSKINHAVLKQTAIFFGIPMSLAIIHSIFGMRVSYMVMELLGTEYMVQSIIMTGVFILLIYGGYFVITYNSCKNMIKNI